MYSDYVFDCNYEFWRGNVICNHRRCGGKWTACRMMFSCRLFSLALNPLLDLATDRFSNTNSFYANGTFSGIFNRLCSAIMFEELQLDAPTLSVDVSSSKKVEEPIALRQHFPETFLWLDITNLGYFTFNSSHLLSFSQHVVWLSVFSRFIAERFLSCQICWSCRMSHYCISCRKFPGSFLFRT